MFAQLTRLRRALRSGARVPDIAVLSVGALRLGGAGKSPVARALCDLLGRADSAIVMRGYGGSAHGPLHVRPHDSPDRVGDEALEHTALGHDVVVAHDRVAGVAFARSLGFKNAVLDDGFQHLALARDLDLVLLTRDDLTARVLPLGPLREPLSALSHAHCLASLDPSLTRFEDRPVHPIECALAGLRDRHETLFPLADFVDQRALLVTGISRPERVARDLARAGLRVVEHRALRDHQRFGSNAFRPSQPIDLVVITAKDAARGARALGSSVPVFATAQRTKLSEPLCQQLRAAVVQRQPASR